ncbi:GHKL domain-containing protein [Limosilactobacillus sp.]|uniref:GHKL domain-containing protein n=1 Tax=Limosilactobacillus sp. TaxID=2773925 RepID=UPI003F09A763
MTFFNINNPFIQAASPVYLWTYIIQAFFFYPLLFWGTYRHVSHRRIPLIFYIISGVVELFLQPNLFLNDLIITLCSAAAVYYFANPNEEQFSTIIAQFGVAMLVYYFASAIGLYLARLLTMVSPQASRIIFFILIPIIYLIALLIILVSRRLFDQYFKIIFLQYSGVKEILSLLFIPLSYFFYVFQFNPHAIVQTFHVQAVNNFALIAATAYYLLALFIMFLTATFIHQHDALYYANVRLNNLENYTSELEVMYDDMRRFRHDYKNILYSLKSALDTNNLDYAKNQIDNLASSTEPLINAPTKVLNNLQNIQDSGIKSIVYSKLMTALEKQLSPLLEVAQPIDLTQTMEPVDVIRVLSILLDNAIYAAQQSPEKKLDLSLYENDNAQFIVVGNSTKESQIDLAKLDINSTTFNLNASHHIGLRNLRIILGHYPQAVNDRSSHDHWFEQRIILPKN